MKKPKMPTRAEVAKARRKMATMQELSDELKAARARILPLLRKLDLEIDIHVLDLRSRRSRTIEVTLRLPAASGSRGGLREATFAAATAVADAARTPTKRRSA